ncbi:MAG: phosphoglycerate kinase [Ectothiorhodospiraceae bacterium]|nr:MAG: phosphoglycerate kinase [Ectothiorhodospiraceae bacterium]
MPNLVDFESIKNKTVILRLDLNVPIENGKIVNDFRLRKSLETIRALRSVGNKLIILSHLGRPEEGTTDESLSLEPIHAYLAENLDEDIKFEREWLANLRDDIPTITLCENTRFLSGEKSNDEGLSRKISELGDIFVFDAFGVAHRKEASTYGVSNYIDYSAGPLLISEINNAQKLLKNFSKPLCTIVSGAKISTKLTLLNTFLEKSDHVILGGGILNTFLEAQGYNIGTSLSESSFLDESKKILNSENCKKIIFPDDVVCAEDGVLENPKTKDISMIKSNDKILDVGVDSISKYTKILRDCKTIFWNGPLGYVEKAPYDKGTSEIAKIIANVDCFSAIGGGDTVPVIEKLGLNDQFSFLSTGGGALMKFFEGSNMPILSKLGLDNK